MSFYDLKNLLLYLYSYNKKDKFQAYILLKNKYIWSPY
ncbi:unknown [Tannerella sp. CAG:118]|uniref:Uncharacterized protein n=1 Tax=Coprobacter secundus subsp. similis TaxID=2751153 RepID=A0A7G1I205_9BACT|nr:hypothetical protein Cop2CBH44_29840 [Coprobacter secundus subsp. similis]CCY37297.1 unknown [Tannerella sp. CAG:118]